jgi:hypothetical protein
VELDHIGDADESEAMADEAQAAGAAERRLVGVAWLVDAAVVQRSGSGVDVIDPDALDAVQKATPRAEEQVVEGRQRGVVVGVGRGDG